jgi:hypothetical protein
LVPGPVSFASSDFKKHKIPFPYPWKASDVPSPVPKPAKVHDSAINTIREIQDCLAANFNIDPKHQRYTSTYKLFSFSLYSLSGVAYDFLGHFVSLACPKFLRKGFGNDLKEYSSELRNADAIASIVSRQPLPADIPCTLCVEAFSVDIFKSKPSTKARRAGSEVLDHLPVEDQITLISEAVRLRTTEHRDCLQENSIFLFLLAPLDVSFRIFPIHLKPL